LEDVLDVAHRPLMAPEHATLVAVDGSQIYPDRHGSALYYLINIGSIVFRQGSGQAPEAASRPEVFFEDADLYEEDGGQVPSVKIDAERDLRELGELARLAGREAGLEIAAGFPGRIPAALDLRRFETFGEFHRRWTAKKNESIAKRL
jgi:hypothetical protein